MELDISPLIQAEMMLYGGASGLNPNCPSYANGYFAKNLYNNVMYPYGNNVFNPIFQGYNQNPNSYYRGINPAVNTQQAAGVGFGATKADLDVLGDYYLKGLSPSETIAGAAFGGAMFKLMEHPRIAVHWINSAKATKSTDAIFADIKKEGTKLFDLWRNPETTEILQEAYARTHKLEAIKESKLGLFRKTISADSAQYKELLKEMQEALAFAGPQEEKLKKIAIATEKIKKATNAYTGHIPTLLRKIGLQKPMTALRKHINSKQYMGVEEAALKNLAENSSKAGILKCLKKSCGWKSALFFAGIELLTGLGNIKEAFSQDSGTGMTQLGQTVVKGIGSAFGWSVGEGIGIWGGAKLGMKLGTKVSPGLGTMIGAIAGMVGGSVGMMLMGRVTHAVVGQDTGEKVKLANMKKTPEGQQQLLSMTLEQAKKDKNLDAKTAQAIQNVVNAYGNA